MAGERWSRLQAGPALRGAERRTARATGPLAAEARARPGLGGGRRPRALDELDLKILAALEREGRLSKQRLAGRVGLSPSACLERMRRLEAAGVIEGYHAVLDPGRIARSVLVFTEVTLGQHRAQDFARFEATVAAIPEVVECFATGGGIDYVLKLVVRDVAHYQQLIEGLLAARLHIEKYFTYVVTKPIKRTFELPIASLRRT